MNNALVLPDLDLTVIPIPKSASSSVLNAIFQSDHIHFLGHADKVSTSKAVALFRHPTERIWCAYKYQKPRLLPKADWVPELSHWYPELDQPFEGFLEDLAEGCRQHDILGAFLPQHEYCNTQAQYTIIPWNFSKLAEILQVKSIPHVNTGKNQAPLPQITAAMQTNLNIVYGGDYRIWDLIT